MRLFQRRGRGSHSFHRVNRRGPRDLGGEERGSCDSWGEERGPLGFGVLLFATQIRQERLCREEKGRKDSC